MTSVSQKLAGIGVSDGFAFGRAHFVDRRALPVPQVYISSDEVDAEVERYLEAQTISKTQLEALKSQMKNAGEEHYLILDTHLLMTSDSMLTDGVLSLIRAEQRNAEWALRLHSSTVLKAFETQEDLYFQERRADIGFVVDRLMRNLLGAAQPNLDSVSPGEIVIAKDLSPADMAGLIQSGVVGFVTEIGGLTSHTAIMARAIELPAVVAVPNLTDSVATGDELIVDAIRGTVLINPPISERDRLRKLAEVYAQKKAAINANKKAESCTQDGHNIAILGNIESRSEAAVVVQNGGAGVGLYRTEYLFIGRRNLPDEDEQFEQYADILQTIAPESATIRTIDLGGDKLTSRQEDQVSEINPAMGSRAIRLCLDGNMGVFETQLRALVRASTHGALRVMIPFVSHIEQIKLAREVFERVKADVETRTNAKHPIEFGVMIEIPSAALVLDQIASEIDFISVGTNDLVQYTLGVDRANPQVAHLYTPEHPAVIRILKLILDTAGTHGLSTTLCGEMGGYPHCLPLLLGLGLRRVSLSAGTIPLIKAMVRQLRIEDCQGLAREIAQYSQVSDIKLHLHQFLKNTFQDTELDAVLRPIWSPVLKTSSEK